MDECTSLPSRRATAPPLKHTWPPPSYNYFIASNFYELGQQQRNCTGRFHSMTSRNSPNFLPYCALICGYLGRVMRTKPESAFTFSSEGSVTESTEPGWEPMIQKLVLIGLAWLQRSGPALIRASGIHISPNFFPLPGFPLMIVPLPSSHLYSRGFDVHAMAVKGHYFVGRRCKFFKGENGGFVEL